jgi:gliding motility-associated-like protein
MPLTSDAYQNTTDGSDFYFFVVSKDAKNLLYATYFGGNASADHVDGGTSRFDADGIIYEAVCASCGGANNDFPTTPGAWSSTENSSNGNCNLAVLKFEFQLTQVHAVASASPSTEGCVPFTISFNNSGSVGDIYEWDFGDGSTSSQDSPSHTYNTPGTYTVRLISFDTLVCNSSDTMEVIVTVFDYAVADFTWSPTAIYVNDVVSFTNLSINATDYFWEFGDGSTATAEHPTHSYADPGTYTVCLTASNDGGCNDSICKNLLVRDIPVIDVPTAFSPNGDNHNDVFYVRGHGVEQLECNIYNRWGELIYTITDLAIGWDGTFKGVPQEMEVYVFTLDATLIDGNIVSKKGNLTLIR